MEINEKELMLFTFDKLKTWLIGEDLHYNAIAGLYSGQQNRPSADLQRKFAFVFEKFKQYGLIHKEGSRLDKLKPNNEILNRIESSQEIRLMEQALEIYKNKNEKVYIDSIAQELFSNAEPESINKAKTISLKLKKMHLIRDDKPVTAIGHEPLISYIVEDDGKLCTNIFDELKKLADHNSLTKLNDIASSQEIIAASQQTIATLEQEKIEYQRIISESTKELAISTKQILEYHEIMSKVLLDNSISLKKREALQDLLVKTTIKSNFANMKLPGLTMKAALIQARTGLIGAVLGAAAALTAVYISNH